MCLGGEGGGCGCGCSSNRIASRDEPVEGGDESVESERDSMEAGEKHCNHIISMAWCKTVVSPLPMQWK